MTVVGTPPSSQRDNGENGSNCSALHAMDNFNVALTSISEQLEPLFALPWAVVLERYGRRHAKIDTCLK